MRALKLSLAGAVITVLLAGAATVAQEAASLAGVVITTSDYADVEWEECTVHDGEAHETCTGGVSSFQFSATDPRLSGTVTVRFDYDYWPTRFTQLEASAVEIANDEGTWVGTGRAIRSMEYGGVQMWTLTGEGPYEGLSAFITMDNNEEGTLRGVIVEGELPPFPDLPAE